MNAIPPCTTHPRQASTLWVQIGQHGACLDLLAPDWTPVRLTDIATSLARLPRWCGNTRGAAYSVAQHSAMVATLLAERHGRYLGLAGLLHDAHEVAIGDIPAPIKAAVPGFAEFERRLQMALFSRFGLDPRLLDAPELHRADLQALATERRDLLPPSAWSWRRSLPEPHPDVLEPLQESRAYSLFLLTAVQLGLHHG